MLKNLTRLFRHVFESKYIKRLMGANLAIMLVASPFLPSYQTTDNEPVESVVVADPATPLTTVQGLQYPLEKYTLTQGFSLFHPAIDMATEFGTPIKPIEAGKVEAISHESYGYGNAVIVDHGNDLTSLYAHMSKVDVTEGEEVNVDTVLGEVGSTGHSTGNHLHLEIREHGIPVNPFTVLPLPKV
ncbi:MAG: M23 family metallopeptidase [Candidatus Microgenomates bacterium]|jgi:murein DD-endopeptidase MepM/ murein hydrolase activator NlpD